MILILSALLFSISSNLDNLIVGIAYGIKKIKIGKVPNLIIAIVTSVGTFLSMTIGYYISNLLPYYVSNYLGAAVLIILGLYLTSQSLIKLKKNNKSKELSLKDISEMVEYVEKSDLDKSGDIDIKEALFVAFGLTLNNLGTGIAASITGVSIGFTVIFTFIFSIVTILLGEAFGNHIIGKLLGKYAPLISGLLLIFLGIIEILN